MHVYIYIQIQYINMYIYIVCLLICTVVSHSCFFNISFMSLIKFPFSIVFILSYVVVYLSINVYTYKCCITFILRSTLSSQPSFYHNGSCVCRVHRTQYIMRQFFCEVGFRVKVVAISSPHEVHGRSRQMPLAKPP